MNKYIAILLIAVGIILVGFLGWSFYQTWIPAILAICMGGMWIIALLAEDDTRSTRSRGNVSFRNSRPRHIAPIELNEDQERVNTRPSLWSRFTSWLSGLFSSRSRTNQRDQDTDTQENATERVAPTVETNGSSFSFWKWMLSILFLAGVGFAWWYYELPWQLLIHAGAVVLALFGLFNSQGLGQFRWLTGTMILATVAGLLIVPQNPEWAFLLTTGILPLVVGLMYVFTSTTNHQLLTSALAVGSFLLMIAYALLTTFGVDPAAAFFIGLVLAALAVAIVQELRERTGITAPGAAPASNGLKWLIALVAIAIVLIVLTKVYGTGWMYNVTSFGFWKWVLLIVVLFMILIVLFQKDTQMSATKKVFLILFLLLCVLAFFFGAWLIQILGIIMGWILMLWPLWLVLIIFYIISQNQNLNWKSIIITLVVVGVAWWLFTTVFDGDRTISYPVPVLDSTGVSPVYEDKGPGTDPNTVQ